MFVEQLGQGFALNEIYLAWSRGFGGQFIACPRNHSTQSQSLSRGGHFENEFFPSREVVESLTLPEPKNEGASRHLAFDKKDSAAGVSAQMADGAE